MADRRKRVKKGLEAVLRSTTEPEEAVEEVPEAAEGEEGPPMPRGRPKSYRRRGGQGKRHTSVYLYPVEFEMMDDMLYEMRKSHGMRVAKTDFWRALLYTASRMLEDPKRAEEFVAECSRVAQE